jgi:hypothetical protein
MGYVDLILGCANLILGYMDLILGHVDLILGYADLILGYVDLIHLAQVVVQWRALVDGNEPLGSIQDGEFLH